MNVDINQTPEQKARDKIDYELSASGWSVQDKDKINWSAGPGIAVRYYLTEEGKETDYTLFLNGKPIGIIEAKREKEGYRLTAAEEQSFYYSKSKLKYLDNNPLPFVYESTGEVTRFTDYRDPKPRSRPLYTFHRPETMIEWLSRDQSLRERFNNLPELNREGLRVCQYNALNKLEHSFKENRPRALIQMATGAGKTYTAISSIYRLLKYADAKRILFLVDTKNLGKQAEQEFMAYFPPDDNRKFVELYNVQRLTSGYIATDSQVCISTIQRLYSILKGEELDETLEEEHPAEKTWKIKEPIPVVYNKTVPMELFDFIVIDECHRSIYNLWKQVLDYFDAFLIGLTATPDKRTFGFFHENIVSEYSHEEAVIDHVNVPYDVYTIETKITKEGAMIEAKQFVDKREKLTRKTRWEQLDEDAEYSGKQLDREFVNPSTIRNIIRTFREKIPAIFPDRNEVPKTLIFAKTDSHADDIIQIVREEFGEGNAFCKKVTYKAEENPDSVVAQFRNAYYPRIAVTVDMIATGTDVKPLECLLFMRDVKSRNYFEQMKGRGTRTLDEDDLKKVTPSVKSNKTHFVIVDAVGVTQSVKTDSRPLERKPSIPLKDLLVAVTFGSEDEDVYISLANRLIRLDKQITEDERAQIEANAQGTPINQIALNLLNAHNPDLIEETTKSILAEIPSLPESEARKRAQSQLIEIARNPFSGKLNDFIENVRRVHEQIIDTVNLDTVTRAEWNEDAQEKAQYIIEDFTEFLETNKDEIAALSIFYNQPYRMREITYRMIKEVLKKLKQTRPRLALPRVWKAYEQLKKVNPRSPKNELTALVALIRRVTGIDPVLTAYDITVNKNFQNWIFQKHAGDQPKFTEEQMNWLRMIKDHIATNFHLDVDDLDYTPFDAQGGRGKMWSLFGDEMEPIILELNQMLVS